MVMVFVSALDRWRSACLAVVLENEQPGRRSRHQGREKEP
jgi:hypothetical protein